MVCQWSPLQVTPTITRSVVVGEKVFLLGIVNVSHVAISSVEVDNSLDFCPVQTSSMIADYSRRQQGINVW